MTEIVQLGEILKGVMQDIRRRMEVQQRASLEFSIHKNDYRKNLMLC